MLKNFAKRTLTALLTLTATLGPLSACSNDSAQTNPDLGSSGGRAANGGSASTAGNAGDGGASSAAPYDCFLHPTTHFEIINACTDAVRVKKSPTLPPLPE